MDVQKFERICRKSQFVPIERRTTPHGVILIAEKNAPLYGMDRNHPEPHWAVLWAVSRGAMDIGRTIYCKRLSRRDSRIALAVADAERWMKDSVDYGRYK